MVRGHRNDIDGLRAAAILPVLFYHAGVWPFAGGYIGVDIFFVISGYLITGLILRAQEHDGFSLVDFYDRRIRRILPALAATLIAATVAALFILLPDELDDFGKNLAASVLFVANIVDWLRAATYFAPDAGVNPLLHVWSLSVEEQFYLLWPLLLIALVRLRRALPLMIGGLAIASLAMALFYARADPNVAFYLLPTRAWQLLAGAVLATGRLAPPRDPIVRNAVALGGLMLIIAAALLPGDEAHYHLLNALGAVLGTAAILYAADGGGNVVSTVLATPVPVFIGRISYSLYLWHWPALVFTRLYLDRSLTAFETGAVLVAVFALSVLSWKFIEQPFRARKALWRGMPASIPLAAAAGSLLLAVALGFLLTEGLPARVPPDVRAVTAEALQPLRGRWCNPGDTTDPACLRGDPSFTGTAILWGDSHARALAAGLSPFTDRRKLRLRLMTMSACPPLPGLDVAAPDGAPRPKCRLHNRAVLDAILAAKDVRLVILEASWQYVITAGRIAPPAVQRMEAALDLLLSKLAHRGIPVLVVGNSPRLPAVPAHCYGREKSSAAIPASVFRCRSERLEAYREPRTP